MNTGNSQTPAHLQALVETTPDALVTIDTESRIQFANPAIEEILGYEPDRLVGEPLTVLMSDDLAEQHLAAVDRYLDTGTRSLDWRQIELPGRHREGHDVPLEVTFGEFTQDGERFFSGILRDVTDRKRRADRLERLNQLGQALLDAETFDEAAEQAVTAAGDTLDASTTAVALYDADAGKLDPRARIPPVEEGEPTLFEVDGNPAWRAFVDNESLAYHDLAEETSLDAGDTALSSAIVVPLGKHGVFLCGDPEPGAFSETTATLAEILAGNTASALDRLDREMTLRSRKAELEETNEQLRRVQRVNREIRTITEALLAAESSAEIKQLVCDVLAAGDQYRFVWFGEHDLASGELVPVASAGVEEGYLDAVTVTADESETGQGPGGHAVRTHEPQVQNDIQSDPPFEVWRQEAMQRGYRASVAVPVVYQGTLYGVLNLYANEPDVFTEMEEAVLSELGEMVGYALNATEQYEALVAEQSVELEFAIRASSNALLTGLEQHGGRFRLENIDGLDSNTLHAFGAFEGVTFENVRELVDSYSGADGVTLVRRREDETVVELELSTDSFVAQLLERGAMPTAVAATGDEARITVRIATSASVREFVELFEQRYGDVELVARRESTDPVQTRSEFERSYLDRLTERQREVLQTAYFAGFFEQPRESSARDVAEMLDVSQPTVSRHVRSGEETLFSMLFGDRDQG